MLDEENPIFPILFVKKVMGTLFFVKKERKFPCVVCRKDVNSKSLVYKEQQHKFRCPRLKTAGWL